MNANNLSQWNKSLPYLLFPKKGKKYIFETFAQTHTYQCIFMTLLMAFTYGLLSESSKYLCVASLKPCQSSIPLLLSNKVLFLWYYSLRPRVPPERNGTFMGCKSNFSCILIVKWLFPGSWVLNVSFRLMNGFIPFNGSPYWMPLFEWCHFFCCCRQWTIHIKLKYHQLHRPCAFWYFDCLCVCVAI